MDKVSQLIKLLHEGNEEVRNFLLAMSVDPEIEVNIQGDQIYMNTPKDFNKYLTRKIDDILERNLK